MFPGPPSPGSFHLLGDRGRAQAGVKEAVASLPWSDLSPRALSQTSTVPPASCQRASPPLCREHMLSTPRKQAMPRAVEALCWLLPHAHRQPGEGGGCGSSGTTFRLGAPSRMRPPRSAGMPSPDPRGALERQGGVPAVRPAVPSCEGLRRGRAVSPRSDQQFPDLRGVPERQGTRTPAAAGLFRAGRVLPADWELSCPLPTGRSTPTWATCSSWPWTWSSLPRWPCS